MNYAFVIDNRKCIGCHACTVACKSEHQVPLGVNRTWVKYVEKGKYPDTRRLFAVHRCNHCDNAPCVDICPVGALYNREDGIVDFNRERCIGCRSCSQACPYDSIYIDPDTNTAAKCNYCAPRIDQGLRPACVNVCPQQAILCGDLEDPQSDVAKAMARQQVQTRKSEKGTLPKLYYIEGDDATLRPLAAPPTNYYIWAHQASGVGHYAYTSEKRVAPADQQEHANSRRGKEGEHLYDDLSKCGVDIANPWIQSGSQASNKEDPTGLSKLQGASIEEARRVLDAPAKGIQWGWQLPAYLVSKAISAGLFFILSIIGLIFKAQNPMVAAMIEPILFQGAVVSMVFLALTGIFLILDLDRKDRFLYVMLRPQSKSWLARGGILINLFGAAITLVLVGTLFSISGATTAGLWLGVLLSPLMAVYTAFLLGQAKGRDFWQSPLLFLHMLFGSALAGAAALALLGTIGGAVMLAEIAMSMIVILLPLSILMLVAELAMPHPTLDAKLTAKMITSGRYALLFWVGVVVVGHILPLLTILFFDTLLMPAALLVLLGLLIAEHIWIRAPQHIPLS